MSVQLVVATGSRAGQVIPIIGDRFVVGRADDCHLKPRSELISRYHCEIVVKNGAVFTRDMGSKNGVFVNGDQITEPCELKNSDKLTIGPLEFFVHITVQMQAQKKPKVKSVSDVVARTVALQSETAQDAQEETIADWLIAAGESGEELETRTINASELIAQLHAQSEASNQEKAKEESSIQNPGTGKHDSPTSSRDAASELLKKFFRGGK